MKILVVLPSLGGGGAERAGLLVAEGLLHAGHDVRLVTLSSRDLDFYEVGAGLVRHEIPRAPYSNYRELTAGTRRAVRALRGLMEQQGPVVVLSMESTTNIIALLAARPLRLPVFVVEQIDPRQHRLLRVWNVLRRVSYRWAAGVVVLSERSRAWAAAVVPEQRVHVIPNPIRVTDGEPVPGATGFVAMGRLAPQKGFDLLLAAYAITRARTDGWRLTILGEGDDRAELQAVAERLGVTVAMPGVVAEPWPVLREHGAFVLSSRYEGSPLALLEARACGLATVAFDCPTGPREIVSHEEDGLLVPAEDVDALAAAMDRVASDGELRRRLGVAAARTAQDFSPSAIAARYEDVILGRVGD